MRDTYSLYEAKAKLSAIISRVREGHSAVITVRGEPVAEINAVTPPAGGLERRLQELAERGILARPEKGGRQGSRPRLERVVRRPGALARFLEDRD